jgi:hypothetical protein
MEGLKQPFRKAASLALVAALAAGALGACARAPQRSPGGNVPGIPANPAADLGEAVKATVAAVPGTGRSEAIVLGNVALVALNLDGDPTAGFGPGPGREDRNPVGGMGGVRDVPNHSVPGGGPTTPAAPDTAVNRPGMTHIAIGQPGGTMTPGTTVPGGSPTGTGAAPNATGFPALGNTNTGATTNGPGQSGTAMDLFTRVADAVKDRFPWMTEVRFAVTREDADRLASIAAAMRGGRPVTDELDDLHQLSQRMSPSSTTSMDQTPPMGEALTPGPAGAPGRP